MIDLKTVAEAAIEAVEQFADDRCTCPRNGHGQVIEESPTCWFNLTTQEQRDLRVEWVASYIGMRLGVDD